MIYLDSAAIVKLVHAESESQALRDWLDERPEVGMAGVKQLTGDGTLWPTIR